MTTPSDDMKTLVQQLTEAMAKATPGPWLHDEDWRDDGADQVIDSEHLTFAFIATGRDEDEHNGNGRYIALCSPSNIARLLAALTEAQTQYRELLHKYHAEASERAIAARDDMRAEVERITRELADAEADGAAWRKAHTQRWQDLAQARDTIARLTRELAEAKAEIQRLTAIDLCDDCARAVRS